MGLLGFGKKKEAENAKKGKAVADDRARTDAYDEIQAILGRIEKTFDGKAKHVLNVAASRGAGTKTYTEREIIKLRAPLLDARHAQQRGVFRNILPNLLKFSELLSKSEYFMSDGTFLRDIGRDITAIEQSLKKGKYI